MKTAQVSAVLSYLSTSGDLVMGSKHSTHSLSWSLLVGIGLGVAACGSHSKEHKPKTDAACEAGAQAEGECDEPQLDGDDCSLPPLLGERIDDYLRLAPSDDSRAVTLMDPQRPGELLELSQSRSHISAGAFYGAVAGGIVYPHSVTYFSDDAIIAADLSKAGGSSLESLVTRQLASGFEQWSDLSNGEAISDYQQEDHGVWLHTLVDSRGESYPRGVRLGGGEPFEALPRLATRRTDQGGIAGFIAADQGTLTATDERFENRSPIDACGLGVPNRATFVSDRVILLRQHDGQVVCRLDLLSLATSVVAAVDDGEVIASVTVAGNALYVATNGRDVVRVRRFALDHESKGQLLLADPGTFGGLGVSCGGVAVIERPVDGSSVLAFHKKNGERLTLELGYEAEVVRVEPTSELLFFNTIAASVGGSNSYASGYIDRSGAPTMWANTRFLAAGNRRYQLQAESYPPAEVTGGIKPIRIYLVDLWTAERFDLGTLDLPDEQLVFGAMQDIEAEPYETSDSLFGRLRMLVDPLLAVTFLYHDAALGLFQHYCLIDATVPSMSCVRRPATP